MEFRAAPDVFVTSGLDSVEVEDLEQANYNIFLHIPDDQTSDLVRVLGKESFATQRISDDHYFEIMPFARQHAMIRPSISYDDGRDVTEFNDAGDIIYGEYPQTIETDNALVLEQKYHQKQLDETGKTYRLCFFGDRKGKEYTEYEYEGARYIRIVSQADVNDRIKNRKPVWIKVEPLKWRLVSKDNEGVEYERFETISKVCIPPLSSKIDVGKLEANEISWSEYFTDANKYLNEHFAKEILPQTEVYHPKKKNMKNQSDDFGIEIDETPMSVTEQIDFYVQNHKSFMLHGPAGIGKSGRVEEIDPDLTALPLWNGVLPEDIVGKVRYPATGEEVAGNDGIDGGGVWTAPDWYVVLCRKCKAEPDKTHVLFIDEVTNARPSTQSLIFNIALRRSITANSGPLPENSVVILAGNSQEESNAAYNMPEPLFRRMCGHIYLTPNVAEWIEWGSKKNKKYPDDPKRLNIHPIVSAFVATFGDKCFYYTL